MNENNIEYRIRALRNELKPSASSICRLKTMTRNSERTRIGKRILAVNFLLLILALLTVPSMAFAAYRVSSILTEKTKNANLTQEEIQQLDKQLKEDRFTDSQISKFHELNVNKRGQTYGPDALGADLIEVIADDGKPGYIYRTDLEATEASSLEEAMKSLDNVVLNVYDQDGENIIGTFTLQNN